MLYIKFIFWSTASLSSRFANEIVVFLVEMLAVYMTNLTSSCTV